MPLCTFQVAGTQVFWSHISLSLSEARDVWYIHPVWSLRAIIWFPFPVSSLVFLPSPLALLSWYFLLMVHSSVFSTEISSPFFFFFSLRNRPFLSLFHGSCWAARRWYDTGISQTFWCLPPRSSILFVCCFMPCPLPQPTASPPPPFFFLFFFFSVLKRKEKNTV